MRVRTMSGVKRVTILAPGNRTNRFVISEQSSGASEKLKFSVIEGDGRVRRGEVRLDLGPVKKSTRALRPVERRLRKLIRAEYKALGRYLELHDQSRRKRRNGWAKDLSSNLVKVIRRS